jgi:hypothetical protein
VLVLACRLVDPRNAHVAMQPDDFGAEQDGFGEQFSIRRQRNVQTRTHQIGFKRAVNAGCAITAAR